MDDGNEWKIEAAILKEQQRQHIKEMDIIKDEFQDFRGDFKKLKEAVGDMGRTFVGIKYSVYGALALYIAQTVGLEKAIKLMLGVG